MLFSLRIPKNVDTLNSLKAVNFGEFIRWGQTNAKKSNKGASYATFFIKSDTVCRFSRFFSGRVCRTTHARAGRKYANTRSSTRIVNNTSKRVVSRNITERC